MCHLRYRYSDIKIAIKYLISKSLMVFNLQQDFKKGDLVKIIDSVYDHGMQDHREGIIVETTGFNNDQCRIMFPNGAILKFHISQVTRVHSV